mgnify:CR=1 FL=1
MTTSQEKRVYVLDANILFGFSLWIPRYLNKIFWTKLEESLQNGEWILLDVVVGEIKYDNGGLKKWCEEQRKKSLIKIISDNHKNRGVEINTIYKMVDETTQKSTVDTYLIAYAEANKLVVFSREAYRTNNEDLYKIPDVCKVLSIQMIRDPKEFIEAIGYKN